MSDELKPCPFCGGEAKAYQRKNDEVDIICMSCECRTGIGEKEECIKAWNTRPPTIEEIEADAYKASEKFGW